MRRKMVKLLALGISIVLVSGLIVGCGSGTSENSNTVTAEDAANTANTADTEAPEADAETRIFRVGLHNPESHPMSQGVKQFGEILAEKSNGAMTLDIYYGGQLGDKATHYQSLQTGVLDISISTVGVIADYGAESLIVYTLPYLFANLEQARNALNSETGLMLRDSIQESGTRMVGLGMYQESARHYFFSDKRVATVGDMKGLKVRCQEGSIYYETMELFGASPVAIAFSELYSAVQTGVVDGAEQPLSGFVTNQFPEVSKYFVLDGHELSPNVLLMSEITWNSLSTEEQQLIRECFNESAEYFNELSDKMDAEYMKTIEEAGVEIIEVEDPEAWQEIVKPIYEKYAAEYAEIIDDLQNTPY